MRRRVVTEVNSLEREILAEEKARAKEKQDLIDAENKRLADLEKKAEEERQKKAKEEIELAKKVAEEKLRIEKELEDAKLKTIDMGFGAAEALVEQSDAASKAVAVAKTIYNTQQAIMNAMANVPAPFNVAQAIATGVMGAKAVQNILSTSPSSTGGSSVPTASANTPAPQMLGGAFELSNGMQPEPLKAFVVTDEMTNSQNQLANIRRRATI